MATEQGINNDLLELKILKEPVWLMTFKFKTWSMKNVEATNQALDFLDSLPGELGLITTSSNPKIYSAGVDFSTFAQGPAHSATFLMHFQRMLARFMRLTYPTVAAVNGHCYAGGLMVAMAHDFRIQRNDFGQMCLSEINLGMPIPWGMLHLISDKVPYKTTRMLAQFGHKFSAQESLEGGLVDKIVPKDSLVQECLNLIMPQVEKSSARGAFGQIKEAIHWHGIYSAENDFLPPPHLINSLNRQKL